MRPIKAREDYARDIASLNVIATAVKRDERLATETRESIVSDLHRAIKKLLALELASIDSPAESSEVEDGEVEDADAPPVTVPVTVEAPEAGGDEQA